MIRQTNWKMKTKEYSWDMCKKISKILKGKAVNGLKSEKQDFIINADFNRKSMKVLKNRSCVFKIGFY